MGFALVGCSGRLLWSAPGSTLLVPSPLHTLQSSASSSSWLLPSCRLLGRFAGVKKRAHLFEPFLSFSDGERMEKEKGDTFIHKT